MHSDIKQSALGKWRGILSHYGLTEHQLSGKHTECPLCGGVDRFRFDDKLKQAGDGGWLCNQCGSGNGIDMAMRMSSLSFKEVAKEINGLLGNIKLVTTANSEMPPEKVRKLLHDLFIGATKDVINPYLENRGITVKPDIWYHRNIAYFENGRRTSYQGMIGVVSSSEGHAISAHRTYLSTSGYKATVTNPRKLTPKLAPINGGAIRLFPHGEVLGIAEGIETACAVYQLTGIPTWSVISASGMESFIAPDGLKQLIIFADNDANGVGQRSAYALASRYPNIAEVRIPKLIGTDFADELVGKNHDEI